MANTYETGCIQNVANFETLISYLTAFGPDYNPSKNSLTIPELQKILSEAFSDWYLCTGFNKRADRL